MAKKTAAKIKKVLYTTDLSENSFYVFQYALNSAELNDAKIDVLYVFEPTLVKYPEVGEFGVLPDAEKDAVKKMNKKVEAFVYEELKGDPARIRRVSSIQVEKGHPVVKILQKIDELKPDMLVMGTHSKGKIARTFLGSVATTVMQHSNVPVLIIPIPA
ncbi:MAG: universal stress protein [Smithellaceae bacterium]